MSRVGMLPFSDDRDFLHQGIYFLEEASGTWRGSIPPASLAARMPLPRTSPRCTCTPRSGASCSAVRRLISLLPPVTLPSPASPAWTVSTGCRSAKDVSRSTTTRRTRCSCARAPMSGRTRSPRWLPLPRLPFPVRGEPRSCGPGDITRKSEAVCRFLEIDLERLDV